MRRLPVFFLVDVSESMLGESLSNLEKGIGAVVSTLRADPYALEMAFISVIVFAGRAKTLVHLTDLIKFHQPPLPVGGGTSLGAALSHLMDEIDRTVVTTTSDRKGDWKPIVFLLTDGHPTDDVARSVERWIRSYQSRVNLIAVSLGGGADHAVLARLTEDVLVFNDAAPGAFAGFIKWISASIQSQSRSVSSGQDGKVSLAKVEPGVLGRLGSSEGLLSLAGVDDRYAVFVGKCAKGKLPYVLKYERHRGNMLNDPDIGRFYAFKSAYPVNNSYFDLSDGLGSGRSISSTELIGQPSCPYCDAQFGKAVCSCGKIHCLEALGKATCPWCEKTHIYEHRNIDIGRGRG